MNRFFILKLSVLAAVLSGITEARAMTFQEGPWTLNAGANVTVLYGINNYPGKYKTQNNKDDTFSSVYLTLSAAYDFNKDYQLAVYYLPNSDGTQYLKNYRASQWTNQAYGTLKTPIGQFQAGMNYNVAYQFYTGAPALGPLFVNDSNITDFLNNPNWVRNGGKTSFYPTLNSTQMNSDNIANKFSYISPTYYGTKFGFSYMPKAYSNQGLISGYAPYRNKEAYVFALANQQQFGDFSISSYLGYGLYAQDDKDYTVGISVSYKNWTLGGSFRRTNTDGHRHPVSTQSSSALTPAYYDGYREGKAWNIGLSYTYDKLTSAVTYFEAKAENLPNKDEYIQFTNQYQLNQYTALYATVAKVRFEGLTNSAADSNKGYSWIAGVSISI